MDQEEHADAHGAPADQPEAEQEVGPAETHLVEADEGSVRMEVGEPESAVGMEY